MVDIGRIFKLFPKDLYTGCVLDQLRWVKVNKQEGRGKENEKK